MKTQMTRSVLLLAAWLALACPAVRAGGPLAGIDTIDKKTVHEDWPALCLGSDGTPWVLFVSHDGEKDTLKLARGGDPLEVSSTIGEPGILHQPALARHGGGLRAFWSQRTDNGRITLCSRRVQDGEPAGETETIAAGNANHVFADAATGPQGRVWIAWQAFENGLSEVRVRHTTDGGEGWSQPVAVAGGAEGGAWLPQLAFADGAAWVAFDQARNRQFDLMLAKIGGDRAVQITPVATGPAYQACASVASTPDGEQLYIAWERGRERWGEDSRSHAFILGLNADKHAEVARFDPDGGNIKKLPPVKPRVARLTGAENVTDLAVNLPRVFVDGAGNPWLAVRHARNNDRRWRVALCRFDAEAGRWSKPVRLPRSAFEQHRLLRAARRPDGDVTLAWPADERDNVKPRSAGVHLTRLDADAELTSPKDNPTFPDPQMPPRTDAAKGTPHRPRSDRYRVRHDGTEYALYFGDFHRHTAFSADRTIWDGSVIEQYRYALEVGGLDFLGPSDHTDLGKAYTPYQWWQTQMYADVFRTPGFLETFYVYEREQSWPWGHRNVIFGERGGPIVYISRQTYRRSPWQQRWPVPKGGGRIPPQQLWGVLRDTGKPVAVISHTPGSGAMGTNWEKYERIDHAVENVVEIFQGARVSYEGNGTPQPTVGLNYELNSPGSQKERYNHGRNDPLHQHVHHKSKGVYRHALRSGHKLGVFASSDHISTNVSFGGVYATEFSRSGVLEALRARRTTAATDKIFLHYTCNGRLLGEQFTTRDEPAFRIRVEGTAPIKRITLVRNESDRKVFKFDEPRPERTVEWTDPKPSEGENRYYVRLQQTDGNMAWASPVWIEYKP